MTEPIYVDYTTLSTFRSCKEKARLSFREHWQPRVPAPSLTFGGAFHAGLDAFYTAPVELSREEKCELAQAAFVTSARKSGLLPVGIDNPEDERRSLERGLGLLEAYFEKWQGETYEVLRDAGTSKPLVEVGFEIFLFEHRGTPVFFVGKMDKIVRNRVDGAIYNFETKTTTQGLGNYMSHVQPNHQITGYHLAAKTLLGIEVVATVWDCIFISSRQPSTKKDADRWLRLGVDINTDFGRTETRRSTADLDEFMQDLVDDTRDYLSWIDSDRERWPRNTSMCNMYGACAYKRVCASNCNPMILTNYFEQRIWDPREKVAEISK